MDDVTELIRFLGVSDKYIPSTKKFSFTGFVEAANDMAKFTRDQYFPGQDLLVFKSTENSIHRGHITDTECRPDITAAFQCHWKGGNTTLWPCIRLVGEVASKGKTLDDQKKQAVSYLHYLLLARPDLHVAQGVLTSKSRIMVLFGIGGVGVRTFNIPWKSTELQKSMFYFIYRLYDPGSFVDPSYVTMVPNLENNIVTYSIRITVVNDVKEIICLDFLPMAASNPFGTRTHILSNPLSKVKINGETLTVIKDQLCRVGTRFDEYGILTRVHNPGKVPGVVEAIHHDELEAPFCEDRRKHRLGLRQLGKPFSAITTLQQMLEIVFDILEVLGFLRFERSILHRDISKGNVLYVVEDNFSFTGATSDTQFAGANNMVEPKDICFVKYLLGESNDPRMTSALLIDFNHAEDLRAKQGPEHQRMTRTGTPVFIARAVELGSPVPLHSSSGIISAVPKSPKSYAVSHPDRIEKFPFAPRRMIEISEDEHVIDNIKRQWRHELDHDTESVFWLVLYWAVGAQPKGYEAKSINPQIWTGLTGSVSSRINLVGSRLVGATHPVYEPLWPLLDNLAAILNIDRLWLESSDPRNDPGYFNEAFQRLILEFILKHRDEEFMKCEVERHNRRMEGISTNLGLSQTSTHIMYENMMKMTFLHAPNLQEGMKQPRVNMTIDETILEVPSVGGQDNDWPMDGVEEE